ncbi:hypothetical protein Kpol_1019p28 [Vanderwaltozyma polyspora DSM 70294]|uniref:Protein SCM3 n=1 Tax=Vanderwaltozyma polyspora (strain ATCC 22028 / DSM 70294 / BCRC 21397 / CBS 2163 / NBRC 10782 / NRRL Y-8283 / UCD 57-17) TaxID=436907 RepID=A7TPC0_VANPO|nr:uncharacterized protein Kpol_1019p28 [Vanderwaltozyma polyspora DSM 70294]EDO15907.1 hypothetical protein Kpol_1019p28 [Vanderwaltozyma polyspora DSM 70294]
MVEPKSKIKKNAGNKKKVSKQKRKQDTIKKLHGMLKNLINNKETDQDKDNEKNESKSSDGIIYIKSKENVDIPKLTDEEILMKHKRADENMKSTWQNIISKYEKFEGPSDVIDLNTGEIVEDNGHIRNLNNEAFKNLSPNTTPQKNTISNELIQYSLDSDLDSQDEEYELEESNLDEEEQANDDEDHTRLYDEYKKPEDDKD